MDVRHLARLVNLLRRERVDLVHSHLFGNNLYGFMAACITGIPIIQTLHGHYEVATPRRIRAYRLMQLKVCRFVVVSETLLADFLKRVPAARGKTHRIYNGIFIRPQRTRAELLAQRLALGLPPDAKVVVCVGNVKPIKGYDILFHAAADILLKEPRAIFLVAGLFFETGPYEQHLVRLLKDFGIQEKVRFLGFRDDITDILQVADVFVLPSHSEGHPVALLEAMATGCPVVATAVGGIPEIVSHEETGLLVRPGDPIGLRDCILFLLEDRLAAGRLGGKGRTRVAEDFSLERMVRAYRTLYQDVLGTNGS